ncbi:MAG: ABC transporter substrate-binding protein, partial [Nitrososphaerota archaeon]|nr:ABC transporter substrate-binding protein [Nitrososphaerota archaeon]
LFPEIAVESWRGGTAELLTKAIGEYRGGVYAVDVFFSHDATFLILHQEGILARRPPEVTLPDGFPSELILDIGYAIRKTFFVIMYNTQQISAAAAPKTLEDLAKPEYRGRLVMPDFLTHTPTIYFLMQLRDIWGERKFWDWMRGVLANRPLWRPETLASAVAVEAGEGAITITVHTNVAVALGRRSPIEWVYLNPLMGWTTPITMASRPQNPNAARLFITFILNDGPRIMQQIGEWPPIIDRNAPVHTVLARIPADYKWLPNIIYPDDQRAAFVERIRAMM